MTSQHLAHSSTFVNLTASIMENIASQQNLHLLFGEDIKTDCENLNMIDYLHSSNRKLHQMPSTCDHLEGPISGAVEFGCLENILCFHFTPHYQSP